MCLAVLYLAGGSNSNIRQQLGPAAMSGGADDGPGRSSIDAYWAALVVLETDEETPGGRLRHLLTGEEVVLPSLEAGNSYDLVEEEGLQLTLHTSQGGRHSHVREHFLSEVQYVKGTVHQVTADKVHVVAPDRLPVSAFYIGVRCRNELFKMKVYQVSWSWPCVWWEARLLGAPWGVSDLSLFFRTLTNTHIANWLKWTQPALLSLSAVRYHSQAKNVTFMDCLPENGISTAALLLITIVKCNTARPREARPVLFNFLRDFLHSMLGDESLELELRWKTRLHYQLGSVPSKASTVVCIDEGLVHLAPVLEQLKDRDLKLFMAAAKAHDPECDFLVSIWEVAPLPVSRQVLGQLARHIDCILPEKQAKNPLDIVESKASVPAGSRRDVALGEMLAMGHGSSASKERAHNTHQHIRSFVNFQPASKRPRNLNPQQIDNNMLLKTMQVHECHWPQVQHLSCGSDGVRVSTKDVVYFLLAGSKDMDAHRAGWAMRATRP